MPGEQGFYHWILSVRVSLGHSWHSVNVCSSIPQIPLKCQSSSQVPWKCVPSRKLRSHGRFLLTMKCVNSKVRKGWSLCWRVAGPEGWDKNWSRRLPGRARRGIEGLGCCFPSIHLPHTPTGCRFSICSSTGFGQDWHQIEGAGLDRPEQSTCDPSATNTGFQKSMWLNLIQKGRKRCLLELLGKKFLSSMGAKRKSFSLLWTAWLRLCVPELLQLILLPWAKELTTEDGMERTKSHTANGRVQRKTLMTSRTHRSNYAWSRILTFSVLWANKLPLWLKLVLYLSNYKSNTCLLKHKK